VRGFTQPYNKSELRDFLAGVSYAFPKLGRRGTFTINGHRSVGLHRSNQLKRTFHTVTSLDHDPADKSDRDDGAECLLIVVFDESAKVTLMAGGVAAVLISPKCSKVAYQSTTLYQHETILRLALESLGVTVLPGAAATSATTWDFFSF